MGGGTSQPVKKVHLSPRVVMVEPNQNNAISKYEPLIGSPFDDKDSLQVSDQSPLQDIASPGSDAMSKSDTGLTAGRLKKMALGQSGYKDQHREYDTTLSKLDINRSGVMNWSDPNSSAYSSPSPNKLQGREFKSFSQVSADSDGSCKSHLRTTQLNPPSPQKRPNFGENQRHLQSYSGSQNSLNGLLHVTQQPVMAPNTGTPPPRQPPRHNPNNPVLSPTTPGSHGSTPSNMRRSFTGGPGVSPPAGVVGTVDSTKRSERLPMIGAPGGGPSHNLTVNTQQSSVGLGSSAHPTPVGSASNTVRPSGLPVRPFPRKDLSVDADDDDMMADFSPNTQQTNPDINSFRPENVPPLSFSSHTPGSQSLPQSLTKTTGGVPPRNFMGQSPAPRAATAGSNIIRSAATSAPIPPTPTNILPTVKETKDVKRNRAQIPATLTHARPTTGDWLNKRYIVNNYILLDTLGTGSYGEVRLCKDRTTDKLFAIKIISKQFLKKKKNGKSNETYFEDIKREIAIMKKLLHPNILKLFEVLDDPNVNKMYLVLEYMKMGDLVNIIKNRNSDDGNNILSPGTSDQNISSLPPLPDIELWNILRQVVAGIKYLHYQNIVHGDIKPQNLLLGEDGIVKIADFGISKMLSASSQALENAAGTPAFMSPELCSGEVFSGQAADIWAIGATIFMLRFGHPPFIAKSIINLYHKICNDPLVFPYQIDPGLKNLLEHVLEKDPTKRFTLQQIIQHPWFRHPPSSVVGMHNLSHALTPHQVHNSNRVQKTSSRDNTETTVTSTRSARGSGSSRKPPILPSFKPPPSYEEEEAAAMEGPVTTVDHDELFMSIGGIVKKEKKKKVLQAHEEHSLVEENYEEIKKSRSNENETNKTPKAEKEEKEVEKEVDLMATNWGDDVFQMVDDDGNDDSDDDSNDDDDSSEKEDKLGKSSINEETINSGKVDVHSEMSPEEEMRRSMRFINKLNKKSAGQTTFPQVVEDKMKAEKESSKSEIKSNKGLNSTSPSKKIDPPSRSSTGASSRPGVSSPINPIKHGFSRESLSKRSLLSQEDEELDQLTMEDFNNMMDTLAMQPVGNSLEEEEEDFDDDDYATAMEKYAKMQGKISSHVNSFNGASAAYSSEKGLRKSQEDRCVLQIKVSEMDFFSKNPSIDPTKKEITQHFSLACIFDGHSGWRCAQHLCLNFPALLVKNPGFLAKQPDKAIYETFETIDKEVCDLLIAEDDPSGCTGVIVIFDGLKHRFTCAAVGDSMCVLSRGGKAVILNKMHRLDDERERERVKRAGGTVVNNRVNGLLAVSRAFGDYQFKNYINSDKIKEEDDPLLGNLVIAKPDIYSEVITPMTEFAILATDGLWDVMTPQAAVSFVRTNLLKKWDLEEVARNLTQEALERGSVDNVTAVVIAFHLMKKKSSRNNVNHKS